MTFCRRGNDYADVAQPFPLTGGSHGGGGDTVDVASETSDRHVPSPPPCSTLPLVLSLAFSWMMEEPLSSTPFKTTKSLCWSNQIQEYFHLTSKRIFQNDELLWQLCSWILPLESGNNLGLSEPPRDLCYPSCYLINRFPKENVTCEVTTPPSLPLSRCSVLQWRPRIRLFFLPIGLLPSHWQQTFFIIYPLFFFSSSRSFFLSY